MSSIPSGASVLVIGRFGKESFGGHIASTLEAMGHPAIRFDPGVPVATAESRLVRRAQQARRVLVDMLEQFPWYRRTVQRRLARACADARIGLTIVTHDFLWPSEVRRIRELTGTPVVLWFPDAASNFGRAWFMLAPYDALFFKDPFIVRQLRTFLKTPVHYLPECFNPSRHVYDEPLTAGELATFSCDICTAGSLHANRIAFFSNLAEYEVQIWGSPPPAWAEPGPVHRMYQGRYVADQEKAKAWRAAKIVVNNLYVTEVWGLNARAFEVAGIGAFQLVDWRPGLSQLFEDGKEIVTFRNVGELREKIDYYLPRDAERHRIAEAGKRRARAEHTYQHRLRTMIDCVFGDGGGYPLPAVEWQ